MTIRNNTLKPLVRYGDGDYLPISFGRFWRLALSESLIAWMTSFSYN